MARKKKQKDIEEAIAETQAPVANGHNKPESISAVTTRGI